MTKLTVSWQWKDWTIATLAVALLTIGGLWLRLESDAGKDGKQDVEEGVESVSVFDVVLDRESRTFLDIFFDRAVGEAKSGEILGRPPATLEPHLAGTWRWRDEQILRFEPNGGFPIASQFELALIEERFLSSGQALTGDSEFTFETDRFLLEDVSRRRGSPARGRGQSRTSRSAAIQLPGRSGAVGAAHSFARHRRTRRRRHHRVAGSVLVPGGDPVRHRRVAEGTGGA